MRRRKFALISTIRTHFKNDMRGNSMHRTERSKVGHLARAALALAAFLMLLPAPGRADTLHTTDDAYVNLGRPGKNFGKRKVLRIGGGGPKQGFARFDTSVLPGDPTSIVKATLRIWIKSVPSPGSIDLHSVDE